MELFYQLKNPDLAQSMLDLLHLDVEERGDQADDQQAQTYQKYTSNNTF